MMKGGRPSLICKRGARGTALFGKLLVLAPWSHSIKSGAASKSYPYFFSLTHFFESATRSTNSELLMQYSNLVIFFSIDKLLVLAARSHSIKSGAASKYVTHNFFHLPVFLNQQQQGQQILSCKCNK